MWDFLHLLNTLLSLSEHMVRKAVGAGRSLTITKKVLLHSLEEKVSGRDAISAPKLDQRKQFFKLLGLYRFELHILDIISC